MKNKIFLGAVLAAIAFVAACSDGVTPKAPPKSFTESCSVILQAYKAGEDPATAVTGDISVAAGEGVVIVWNGSHVSSATLSSEPEAIVGPAQNLAVTEKEVAVKKDEGKKDDKKDGAAKAAKKDEPKKIKVIEGSAQYDNLTETVGFIVKAKNEDSEKDPKKKKQTSECEGRINVAVSPASAELAVNRFDAAPSVIKAGEAAKLCWDVTPAEAAISIKDDKGNEVGDGSKISTEGETATPEEPTTETVQTLVATGKATAIDEEGEEVAPPAEEAPAPVGLSNVGCTNVSPSETTTYTLTATSGEAAKTATATVTVVKEEFNVTFLANGQENLTLPAAGEVNLSWEVTPADAIVTIDNEIGEVKATGSTTVKIEKAMTYTLSASLGTDVVTKQVTISIQASISALAASVKLAADATDVFEGESVTFSVSAEGAEAAALPADLAMVLDGPEGRQTATGTSITVQPTISGTYTAEVSGGGLAGKSNQVKVTVRKWKAKDLDGKWASVEIVSDKLAISGSFSNKPGAIKVGRLTDGSTFEEISYDFASAFKDIYFSSYNKDKLGDYGSFPVNAIVKDPAGSRLYAAIAGGLLYSDNSGQSWDTVEIFALPWKLDSAKDERESCKGSTQIGDKSGKNTVANLAQACDVAIDGNRVIVAMDLGVIYMDDVDTYVANRKKGCWQGLPEKKCATQNDLGGTVVNDLLSYGGKIFAGTAKGVYVSENRAETWTAFNGGDLGETAIYAMAIDSDGKQLYAAGPDGVYSAQLGTAEWKKGGDLTEAGKVYTLATDPAKASTVYVGAEKGVFVSRDVGGTWKNVTASMGGEMTVYGLAVSKGTSSVGIFAATSGGLFRSVATSATSAIAAVQVEPLPEIEPVQAPEEVPTTPTEALKALLK